MTVSRFVLVDFRYTSDALGHIRLYEAGNTYDMPPTLAHAAAKRDLVAAQRPVDWEPPSILRPPEVLTEAELAAAEAELKALQRHAFEVVTREPVVRCHARASAAASEHPASYRALRATRTAPHPKAQSDDQGHGDVDG